MEFFGVQVSTDENSPRYYVWEIVKLAKTSILYGIINTVLMMLLSFSIVSVIIGVVISVIVFFIVRLAFYNKTNKNIAIINQMVSQVAYDPDDVEPFENDIIEDNAMNRATGKITVTIQAVLFYAINLLLFIVILVIVTNLSALMICFAFLIPWIYMATEMTKQAEESADNDFKISLNGGLNKMYHSDSVRTSHSRG